jgi:hypothetical protein
LEDLHNINPPCTTQPPTDRKSESFAFGDSQRIHQVSSFGAPLQKKQWYERPFESTTSVLEDPKALRGVSSFGAPVQKNQWYGRPFEGPSVEFGNPQNTHQFSPFGAPEGAKDPYYFPRSPIEKMPVSFGAPKLPPISTVTSAFRRPSSPRFESHPFATSPRFASRPSFLGDQSDDEFDDDSGDEFDEFRAKKARKMINPEVEVGDKVDGPI